MKIIVTKMKLLLLIILINLFPFSNIKSQSFDSLPPGLDASTLTLFIDPTDSILYAGGTFLTVHNSFVVNGIAQWDGTIWDSLSSGGDQVRSIVKYDGKIMAGGNFPEMGGVPSIGVASWDGNNWIHFGDFTTSWGTPFVYKLFVHDSDLYIGGGFNYYNGIPANEIVKFDGTNFQTFPYIDSTGAIVAMEFYNGELYVGGNFNGGAGNDILKFDGTNWLSVGSGFSGTGIINAMVVFNNELYVSGHFLTAYGDPGDLIAKWNGTVWSSVGTGLQGGNCLSMNVFNNELYVAGTIFSAGGIPVDFIAKWDGLNWHSLNIPINGAVNYITSDSNNLYIGGGFTEINNQSIVGVARYNLNTGFEDILSQTGSVFNVYYSPNMQTTFINANKLKGDTYSLEIFDLIGKSIFRESGKLNPPYYTKNLNCSAFAKGMYVTRLYTDKEKLVKKFVVE